MKQQMKESISLWQLFVLMTNFEIGSAVVVGIGNEAKQDAWIALIGATVLGMLLMWMYYFLLSRMPGKNLYEIMEFVFGRVVAKGTAFIFIISFFYTASRVLRDFTELMASAILPDTPVEVISLSMMLLIGYILYLGLEVVGRTSEIFFPYVLLFILLVTLLLIIEGEVKLKNLQPVLAEGWSPVFHAVFPGLLGFPFGEMCVFMLIMSHVSKFNYAGKVGIAAVGGTGILLTITTIVQISALGVDGRARANFPLLSAAREISIANFLERLDALVVFIMMLGILIKVTVYFFAGLKGLEYVFNIPYRNFTFPIAMIISLFSTLIADDFSEHIEEGLKFVPKVILIPIYILFPALILLLLLWKQRRNHKSME